MIPLKRVYIPRKNIHGFEDPIEQWSHDDKTRFLNEKVSFDSLTHQCRLKSSSYSDENRALLISYLNQHYPSGKPTAAQQQNLQLLVDEATFTITTGHQLSLALGPLFLIYKALHVINLCEQYNQTNTGFRLVPMFWLATEDHDFEEVKNVHFFNKTITWENNQGGPVGRLNTEGLEAVYSSISSMVKDDVQEELKALFQIENESYRDHYKSLLNKLFGPYGLLIIDGDDINLKQSFIPHMQQEINARFIEAEVQKTNEALSYSGKKVQAFVRPVNLFYLSEGRRDRIIPNNGSYLIQDKIWDSEALLNELSAHPDRFSPNVLFRPLYQEFILPNVCYVGGGGELSYWAQLKSAFIAANIPFPLLQTRVSAFIFTQPIPEATLATYFEPLKNQIEQVLSTESSRDALFDGLDAQLEAIKTSMNEGIQEFNSEAIKWCGAQITGLEAAITHYKQRWQKEEKIRLASQIKGLERTHQALFPTGIPQERYLSLLHFCNRHGYASWVEALKKVINPLSEDIHIFMPYETE